MTGRVIVVGSVNVDLVASVERLPAAGETVTGGTFARYPGGKGGNQATAAARLGAQVVFVGAVGSDPLAAEARGALASEGVEVGELATVDGPTGVALILVDGRGENVIAVAPGANEALTSDGVTGALARLEVGGGDVVVACNEIPADAVLAALHAASDQGAIAILNPAPAAGVTREHLDQTDVLIPNRVELRSLAGSDPPAMDVADSRHDVITMARTLLAHPPGSAGVRLAVVVTLGGEGAVLVRRDADPLWIAAPVVGAVDTVGAGDTFVGALAAGLAEGRALENAAVRAVVAASLSTTKAGARGGMPTSTALETALEAR